jgi:hypothetical protein
MRRVNNVHIKDGVPADRSWTAIIMTKAVQKVSCKFESKLRKSIKIKMLLI